MTSRRARWRALCATRYAIRARLPFTFMLTIFLFLRTTDPPLFKKLKFTATRVQLCPNKRGLIRRLRKTKLQSYRPTYTALLRRPAPPDSGIGRGCKQGRGLKSETIKYKPKFYSCLRSFASTKVRIVKVYRRSSFIIISSLIKFLQTHYHLFFQKKNV